MSGLVVCFFFFLKQKTAYEIRISDWSSDVCSSDLRIQLVGMQVVAVRARGVVCKFLHLADGRRDRLQHQSQRKEPQHENAQERQPAMGAKTGHGRAGYRTTGGYTISFESPFPTNNAAMHAIESYVRSFNIS